MNGTVTPSYLPSDLKCRRESLFSDIQLNALTSSTDLHSIDASTDGRRTVRNVIAVETRFVFADKT